MPVKLARRHGSPYWYIRGSIRGVRVDESTGVSDREAAEEIRIQRSAEILKRSIHGDAVSRTFGEAALSYMQAGGERAHLEPLLKLWGRKSLSKIGQDEIEQAGRKLKPGAAPATVNRHVFTPAVAVLHHAALKGWCPKPVIERPKQPAGRVRWISHGEARRLIDSAAPHLRPLVIFLLCTGARLSEALYLDWRQVDLSACHVEFLETKNGERRGVPLHAMAVAALANLPGKREGAVFRRPAGKAQTPGQTLPSRQGKPYSRRTGGGGQVSTAWATMCERAGITDFTPHDCRHTWATWHYRKNRNLGDLMELGGWKSADMVLRYAHVNSSHLAAGIDELWNTTGTGPQNSPTLGKDVPGSDRSKKWGEG